MAHYSVGGERMSRRGWAWYVEGAGLCVLAYFTVCGVILSALLAPPRLLLDWTPSDIGLTDWQDVELVSPIDSEIMRAYFVPGSGSRAIILTHGYSMSSRHCTIHTLVRPYHEAGFAVLGVDLRGFGVSGGDHMGMGILDAKDLRSAVEFLKSQGFASPHIGIHGQSYGAAIAIMAAAEIEDIGAVIADSGFSRLPLLIGGGLSLFLGLPPQLATVLEPGLRTISLVFYGLDLDDSAPAEVVRRIEPRPLLLVHGSEDSLVGFEQYEEISRAAGTGAVRWVMEGADHTQGLVMAPDCAPSPWQPEYIARSIAFFDRSL